MGISKPFHRNYRMGVVGLNSVYILDPDYAKSPEHYVRSFLLIQEDILRLFQFIEPSDINLQTYSFRIHELYMRICIEIEANFKAIFDENKYSKPERNWNIIDYKKINKTHHLDEYKVTFPIWSGTRNVFQPFIEWQFGDSLSWYKDYNACKHNRANEMPKANLGNLLNSFSALFVLLSSQFYTEAFSPGNILLALETGAGYYSGEFGIGDYLMVEFPTWPENEKYDFDWNLLKSTGDKFAEIDYDTI